MRIVLLPPGVKPIAVNKYMNTNKRHYFRKTTVFEHKICVLVFSKTFVRNVSHAKKTGRNKIKNVCWSSCKVGLPGVLNDFSEI